MPTFDAKYVCYGKDQARSQKF